MGAARGEAAAAGPREQRIDLARNRHQRRAALVAPERRQAVEEPARVGMAWVAEDLADRPLLDQLARVHHAHAVADADHGPQVVADEEDGRVVPPAQRADQVEHGRLDRDVEPGRRLVQDQEGRLGDQGHGDDDPLLLAAGELVRVAPEHALRIGQVDLGQHPERSRAGLGPADAAVDHRRLHELAAHRHHRVEARRRILVDHRDPAATDPPQLVLAHPGEVAPLEEDLAAHHAPARAEVPHDRQRHGGLAAARLADEAQRLPGAKGQAQGRDDIHLARPDDVRDPDVPQLEDQFAGRRRVSHGALSPAARWPGG